MAYTTINKPNLYFNTVLYTGNGTSQSITGVGFQPDMVWGKIRDTTRKHNIYDVIRGVEKRLVPNDTVVEDTVPGVTAFNSDGFSVGSETDMNQNGNTFVGWSWKANGAGVSNTSGSISSTVSANTTAGFSIVSYTGNGTGGATFGHGLGVTPKMFIIKQRTDANPWVIYHTSVDVNGDYTLRFDTGAKTNANDTNNDTAPTSSLITLGASSLTNQNTSTYIAYCFAEVKGFSKFGSYVGNGNANGTFIYTGFRPSFFLIKNTTTAGNGWHIFDNKRIGFNTSNYQLSPNSNGAEDTTTGYTDILSNGFKMRSTNDFNNKSGDTYIYMAFAEQPLVGTNNIPATAR
jgi:hypothetical protein